MFWIDCTVTRVYGTSQKFPGGII